MKPGDIAIPQRLGHLSRDPRGYPVIATVDRDSDGVDFGSINEQRKLVLATFDWCAICGLPFRDETRWQFLLHVPEGGSPDAIWSGEAPVHEICGFYAAQICPFLSSPGARLGDDGRRGQRRPASVLAAGYTSTDAVDIKPSGLQDDTYVVHFAHTSAVDRFTYSDRNELRDRYQELLAAETPIEVSPGEKTLVDRFNAISAPPGEDNPGATVAGAAVMAGAGYARNVFRLGGMKPFHEPVYATLASHFLTNDGLCDLADTFRDESGRAAAQWLLEQGDQVPPVLAHWRERGMQQTTGRTTPKAKPQGPGRSVPKNAACPCGSGRKAGRCHPAGL
ncbi:SEC-C metal-binding domain-containing protein [Streptomyces sp. FH025]|uniref:SEC-C metal-binding domain-containing protein n=1 Tax=Streptomyces sp. FH025 TaxID=2815937 RepID=UPI001A9DEE36|nr:SEC-C metal-binding domain-containing protein [Streptomyces sp. FH025]MBO1414664.1 SEC-C domain-containing protein [Streptomyces sp. FH025]